MKYRTDFVTNSSSSSSVVVNLDFGNESRIIEYHFEEPGFYSFEALSSHDVKSYQNLLEYLMNALISEQLSKIIDIDYSMRDFDSILFFRIANITLSGEVVINIEMFKDNQDLFNNIYLHKIKKLIEIFIDIVSNSIFNYDSFSNSKIWEFDLFSNLDPKNLRNINESIENQADIYRDYISTRINVIDLKVSTNNNEYIYDEFDGDYDDDYVQHKHKLNFKEKCVQHLSLINNELEIPFPHDYLMYLFEKSNDYYLFFKILDNILLKDKKTINEIYFKYLELETKLKKKLGNLKNIIEKKPKNIGKKWSFENNLELDAMYKSDSRYYTIVEISELINRDVNGILFNLFRLAIINKFEFELYIKIYHELVK